MSLVPLRARTSHWVVCLITVAGLSACSPGTGGSSSRPATIQSISNAQQMGDVIDALDHGRTQYARKWLKQMLKRDPADEKAAQLLRSLDADPVALLGTRSFSYKIQSGDSMTELARRYLGDRLKFYALARYNGMDVPSSLRPGQLIRIPGDAPRQPVAEPKSTLSRPNAATAASAAPSKPVTPKVSPTDPKRASTLRGEGLAALNRGQVDRAVALLRQAAALDPSGALIKRDLERSERIRKTVQAKR